MWKRYFKFIKLRPGRMITQLFGEIDFSSDMIPLQTIKALYESDFPYLEITSQGKADLYGILPELTDQIPVISDQQILEQPDPEPVQVQNQELKSLKAIRKKKNPESL